MGFENWMQEHLPLIRDRTLKEICIAGSHDAGMCRADPGTAFGTPSITITQNRSVLGQLEAGVRIFDIRPVISAGRYVCGHYSKFDLSSLPGAVRTILAKANINLGNSTWQGANGQSIAEIVEEINRFTAKNAEIVILDCTTWCGFNTDTDNSDYRWFNQDEWQGVIHQLSGLQNRFCVTADQARDLTSLPISSFIGNGKAAVFCIVKDEVNLNSLTNQGFFKRVQFDIPGNRQSWITKEQNNPPEVILCIMNDKGVFNDFLSKVLLGALMVGRSFDSISIRGLAKVEKRARLPHVVAASTLENFPNQIWVDDVGGEQLDAARVALDVTLKVCQGAKPKL